MPTEIKKPTLSDFEVEVASLIEQLYYETGNLPTNEFIAQRLVVAPKKVEDCFKKEIFRQSLIARGIRLYSDTQKKDNLTPQQLLLVNMLLNVQDKKSIRQKLEQAGVTTQQYNAWLRDPTFQNYIKIRAEEVFKAADADAYLALTRAVQKEDVQALKLFFEMRGIYNPKLEVQVNIEGILLRVVEVVSKYVSPEILAQIADELEGVSGTELRLPQKKVIPALASELKGDKWGL